MAMAAAAASVRQRKRRSAADAADAAREGAAAAAVAPPLTRGELANYYFSQHVGLVVAAGGIALLCVGYGREWMHDTHLCLLSLALCLLGLFFHETRPFNAQALYEEKREREREAAE